MAAIAFTAWLNAGEDYETGRALYDRHGTNGTLKTLLALGATAYNLKRLREALQEVLRTVEIDANPQPAPTPRARPQRSANALRAARAKEERAQAEEERQQAEQVREQAEQLRQPPVELASKSKAHPNPAVQALIEEKLSTWRDAQHLHAQLRVLPTDAARLEAARQIKALMRRNQHIWDDLQYFDENGHLPPAVAITAVPDGPAAMVQRVKTLRTYITHQRGDDAKRAAWRAEMLEMERRLADE